MGELIANVLLFATNATIAVTRFFEPFVSAYINYYKDAFATGNLVVIAFAFLLSSAYANIIYHKLIAKSIAGTKIQHFKQTNYNAY